MWIKTALVAGMVAGLALLAGCQAPGTYGAMPAGPGYGGYAAVPAAGSPVSNGFGVVQAIDTVPRENSGVDIGTVGGAVVGGLLGNQVGQGRGNTAATIAGAAGGALVGREVERNMRPGEQVYRITVRLDSGALQAYVQQAPPSVRIGDRVRIVNGVVQAV